MLWLKKKLSINVYLLMRNRYADFINFLPNSFL